MLKRLSILLSEVTERVPTQSAIECDGSHISYAELWRQTTDLVLQIQSAGLTRGARVAIAADRSAHSIIAILAAVQAGMAYVPLDLAYPAERLRHMLGQANVRAVLGSPEALASLVALVGEVPTLASPATADAEGMDDDEADLTYVLFTSGSTGMPKGVAMGSLPLQHLIEFHARHPRLGQPARTLQFAPLSFDVHFQEIFSTLACGGTLVLLSEAERRDPALLNAALQRHRVERLFVPFVALQMLADAAAQSVPSTLRDVISAGEQLQVTPAIRRLFARLPGAALHNHYGPTETHVVTAHELHGDVDTWPDIPPIGVPLPHVRVALLAVEADPPELGQALWIGGETLAQGYLGAPGLTLERFRQDPPGLRGRWYQTGDLVREGADGVLTYLGRADQQLKVDGFRIEAGEIELALMKHEAVKDAVVTAPTVDGSRQLMAHLVLHKADEAVEGPAARPLEAALAAALRQHLRAALPEYMVPSRWVQMRRLPTTPSGKIDRRGLPVPAALEALDTQAPPIEQLRHLWQTLLGLPTLGDDQNLFDLGARSLMVLRFVAQAQAAGLALSVADVYDRPTLRGLCEVLAPEAASPQAPRPPSGPGEGVAIVGMALRVPGGADVGAFWDNLMAGREGIRHFRPDELDASVPAALRERPNFVAARGVLEDADGFDLGFFGLTERDATLLDPQQRLLLELCWTGLEHAGVDPGAAPLRVGTYLGTANNTYAPALRQAQPELIQQAGEFATMLASEKDYAATRVAHRLDLHGPAVSVHTACSTGLVAVAQAWHALASGQCDVALAGGATVIVPQASGYLHVDGGMESSDGHCRPFDASASGTVFSSGGAVVVLKRLRDALADGDTVYAVIKGVGLNNDGGDKASFTAPSVSGQAQAVRMALDHAGVNARSIGYVEAHGTATVLGDPIEVAALTRAWRQDTPDTQFCHLGSVKGNLGHMVAAAGVVGLIKAALALHTESIPHTLHFKAPNPHLGLPSTPFRVVAQPTAWPRGTEARRAAVSSFGVGGTNAHVILEEAPLAASLAPAETSAETPGWWMLPLSARSPAAAQRRARDLANHIERHPHVPLADVVATLTRGRQRMPHRLSVVARTSAEAVAALRQAGASMQAPVKPRVVFMFPGQGAQHPGMARQLYDEAPAFREALDACLQGIEAHLGVDMRPWLVAADPADTELGLRLAQTQYAQPALFAMSHALATWLDSLGVQPDAMIGHSIGEYVAACRAGVMSVDDALRAVVARGQAMAVQPPGAMLAVRAGADTLAPWLDTDTEIAAFNAPGLSVVAGPGAAIEALMARLDRAGIGHTRLRVSHAFHSRQMEGALPQVVRALAGIPLHAPRVPVYSCVTGSMLSAAQATDPQYWARQVRAPVHFTQAVQAEMAMGATVWIEVGPGQALTALLRQHRQPKDDAAVQGIPLLGTASQPGEPMRLALQAVGRVWCAGVALRWPVPRNTRRAVLPTYPFERTRCWFAARPRHEPAALHAPVTAPASPAPQGPSSHPEIATVSRRNALEKALRQAFSEVSGLPADDLQADTSLVEQGLDSLSMTQATLELERIFGIKLRLRQLLEDLNTVRKLGEFLDAQLPPDRFAPPPAPPLPAPTQPPAAAAQDVVSVPTPQPTAVFPTATLHAGDGVQQLIQQQLQLMSQQLQLLGGQPQALVKPSAAPAQPTPPASPTGPIAPVEAPASTQSLVAQPFGASPRLTLKTDDQLSAAQRQWLQDFIGRYNARTGRSKAFSQAHRQRMADPRVVTGFNPQWKDLVYPIVVERSQGARVWDIDGHAYIDLLSCFGANLLGYQPPGVIAALHAQLDRGMEVGPQHPLAAEVAALISEFTGMARVGFCNTGSEAVMGAMRIARTVTGRKTIAIFTNSYHGIFDEVIVRGTKQLRSLSAAPGILANAVENVLVLDYASEDSLQVLRQRAHELAAIMIEPVQNKLPTLQPRAFVQSLREIADEAGCALIFDEVVTGFRLAPGGAQAFYGVRADIATYGKIIGGGLPFAAIAGSARWLDALDGGHWQYGDDSYPEAGVTYFAGTFVRHPLALAAAHATLSHIKAAGPALYAQLNGRTQRLVDGLNRAFAQRGAPVRAVHCASLWRLSWDDHLKHVSLFYYLARFHGLHLYEQFGHFVTEAMSEADIDRIIAVFVQSLDELMAQGFISARPGTPPSGGGGGGGGDRAPAKTDSGPLSPGQTERWLAASFDPAARVALNESFCVSLKGAVDLPALRQALDDVTSRHDAFRIGFDSVEPVQRRAEGVCVPIAEVDLRDQPDADSALDRFASEASTRDFALERPPLAAVSLVHLADQRVVVHVVASHLVFDGWASSVFNAELAEAYRARCAGRAPQWPPAESPVAFAAAEQARMQGPQGQAALRHWERVLNRPPAPLSLGDRQPGPTRTYAGDTLRMSVPLSLLEPLREQARAHGATLFQLLLTAVTAMLHQRSGQQEFVVSIPFASQSLDRHGPLMADGVLDLPLRLRCEPQDTALQLLLRVRGELLDALEQPVITQGTVARALGLRSTGDRAPLSRVYFNLNPKVNLSAYAPLEAQLHEGRKRGILNELFFNFYETDHGLTLDLHHGSEYVSPALAQRLLDDLRAHLEALARPLTAPLTGAAARTLTPAEAQRPAAPAVDPRLWAWNATDTPLAEDARVEQWIARQAEATPDAVALTAQGQSLTYRQLRERALRVAHVLRARGVDAGQRVGVCLGRGLDLVPALLGVWHVGAAYVPLDPAFPQARLRDMADDAQLGLVITQAAHAGLSSLPRERQLRMDDDAAELAAASTQALPAAHGPSASSAAYVIYTSGSTGRPKGVVVPQLAVCNFIASMCREPGLQAGDRLLAVTTLSFDIAVLELFVPLTVGAQVVLAQRDDAMDGEALSRLLASHEITVMQATPTTWHMLLDTGWTAARGLRALCGGEPLPPSLAARLLNAGVQLWNMYGPTETTVWSTLSRIQDPAQAITIGRPIDNTQVWVLDEAMQPCAIGQEGELCIGGLGVALGYLHRPELSAERFLSDPFRPTARGARLYRTGDLARWREDGSLDHLGRMDHQVKIRGYRIELGEIEARLAALPGVGRTVVAAREDSPGDVRLVAYVVAQPALPAPLTEAALRDALRPQLPDYMLPQHVVLLDALPLLPNGKIDRKALPPPTNTAQPDAESRSVTPPRDALETRLAQAMQDVLKVTRLGVDDDFFSLGGHSLLAARLMAQINRDLGLQLNLRVLFEAPTVARLARVIAQAGEVDTPRRAPLLARANASRAPLTLMQERIHFVELMSPGRVLYNAPSAHRLVGPLDIAAFQSAFATMVQRQSALRTCIVREGHAHVQRVLARDPHGPLVLEDLTAVPAGQREQHLAERLANLAEQPFDLARGPLYQARLFKLADAEHALFFMAHHIIWDGWSFDVLYTEMAALYEAACQGTACPLAPLSVSFGDFCEWHRAWMGSEEIRSQIDFWRAQIALSPEPRQAPVDTPRQRGSSGRGATEFMHIPQAQADRLRELARQTGSTVSIVCLAAYTAVMADWLQDDIPSIGLPVRGRPLESLDPVMGFFNNMLPLRLRFDAALDASGWIKSVRQQVTQAFANQDVPFELLAQTFNSPRLYQAMYSFQDARQRPSTWGALRHTRIPLMHKGATEDINLWLVELEDGIEGGVHYDAGLFLPSTAAWLRDRFLALLERLVQDPAQSVQALLRQLPARQVPSLRLVATTSEAPPTGPLPARTPTGAQETLARIWQDLLQPPQGRVRPQDNFFALGGSSLMALQCMARIESELGIKLPLTTLAEAPTLRQLAQRLQDPAAGPADTLVCLREGGDRPPLFFVHDGDGETLLYRNLALALHPDHPIYGLQPCAADGIAMVHTRVSEMAAYHVEKIRSVQPHGPYLLSGLCAGGVIAFEVACLLQSQGEQVGMLALLDAADGEAVVQRGRVARERLQRFTGSLRDDTGASWTRALIRVTTRASGKLRNFLSYEALSLWRKLRIMGQVRMLRWCLDRDLQPPAFLRQLSVRQIYACAELGHAHATQLEGPLWLFRATQGDGTSADEAFIHQYKDPLFGWARRVRGEVRPIDIPGGHSSMLQPPHVEHLAKAMQDCIDLGLQPPARPLSGAPPLHIAA